MSPSPASAQALSKQNLLRALSSADYFYWSRHVSATRWFWYEGEHPEDDQRLRGDELPELGPVVIHTPSCRSFTPWTEGSIALAFTDHGAAAYLGHLYSPTSSGTFIDALRTLPGYDTWPGFPMGTLAQIQNRASERAFARYPCMYMLGDPRLSLRTSAPYTITVDAEQGSRRVIHGTWESAAGTTGILPLRIAGGADYGFTQVEGVGAVGDEDPFYHGALQTLNQGEDEVVLILHPPGTFQVVLRRTAPLFWRQRDARRDAFEFAWCSIAPMQSWLGLLPLGALAAIASLKRKRGKSLRPYLPAAFIATGWAGIQLGFSLIHRGGVSVTSYVVNPATVELGLAFAGTFACVALGLIVMLDARRPRGVLVGLAIGVAPPAAVMGFYTGLLTLLNCFAAGKTAAGLWPLNYNPVRMLVIVLTVELAALLTAYRALWKRRRAT